MPILTHLNGEMNKINRRIVKAMLKQAQVQMPDIPTPPIDSDVNVNYLSLLKSLTNILLNLREMYAYRFGIQPEGEAEDDDISDLSESEGSQASSGLSGFQSQASYAPFGSQQSSVVSQPFFRRGVNSPESSVYSQPVSRVSLSTGQPSSRYSEPFSRNYAICSIIQNSKRKIKNDYC